MYTPRHFRAFNIFEGVIGIGGDRPALPEWLLPVVVIGIRIVVLRGAVLDRRDA